MSAFQILSSSSGSGKKSYEDVREKLCKCPCCSMETIYLSGNGEKYYESVRESGAVTGPKPVNPSVFLSSVLPRSRSYESVRTGETAPVN